jgi:hypothetical protein
MSEGEGCGLIILLVILIYVLWFFVYFCYVVILNLATIIDFSSIFLYGLSGVLIILCIVWASKVVRIQKEKQILAKIKSTLSREWK